MRRLHAVLGVLLVTFVSACGGGDGGGTLSVEEFREQAEAICRDVEQTDVAEPTGLSDVGRFVDEFAQVIEQSAADFRELRPPGEFQERWDEYLALVDDAVSKVRDLGYQTDGASAADLQELAGELVAEVEELATRGHEIERELGLDECID